MKTVGELKKMLKGLRNDTKIQLVWEYTDKYDNDVHTYYFEPKYIKSSKKLDPNYVIDNYKLISLKGEDCYFLYIDD